MNKPQILLAVRTVRLDVVKLQLLSILELETEDILALPTKYSGITLLKIDECAMYNSRSIRNIEALVLEETAAAQLLKPTTASEAQSLVSVDSVDEREQYEHLSQLLHIQTATKDNR